MIEKIKFKDSTNLIFEPANLNLFVGPNNAGKSMTLREIYYGLNREIEQDNNIVDEIRQNINFTDDEIDSFMNKYSFTDQHNLENIIFLLSNGDNYTLESEYAKQILKKDVYGNDHEMIRQKLRIVNSQYCRLITGTNRLSSFEDKNYENDIKNVDAYDFQNSDYIMNKLISDNSKYLKVRKYIYSAFQKYFTIKLNKGMASFVLTDEEISKDLELSIRPETVNFLENAADNKMVSDGVKAYTMIICELIAGDAKVLFIDEPEAFLHPPLAKRIGRIIGKLAIKHKKQIFISTHSSDFLMGCIEVNIPTNLIRFTYENNIGKANLVDWKSLQELMKKPILRTTNFLDAIFHKKVVVTEGDSDRAFYNEINYRMLNSEINTGIEDCLFLNAQNKQTVGDIVEPLRRIGIPAVGILDLDMIKEGGQQFTKYLTSVNIPESSHEALQSYKRNIVNVFSEAENNKEEGTPEIMKNIGIEYLKDNNPGVYKTSIEFINSLKTYGLFIVHKGELESWLESLEPITRKNNWLTSIFNLMGDDPSSNTYLKPGTDDVWKFISEIKEWLDNPLKDGME